jgi:hypothetical protein
MVIKSMLTRRKRINSVLAKGRRSFQGFNRGTWRKTLCGNPRSGWEDIMGAFRDYDVRMLTGFS